MIRVSSFIRRQTDCLRVYWERRYFLAALLSTSALLAVAYIVFHVRYETVDDVGSHMYVMGMGYTEYATEYLLYTHVWIGLFLKWLYQNWPAFPWYGLYLSGLQFIAIVCIGYSILRLRAPFFLWFAWLIIFGLIAVILLQFSVVALMLAGGGIALLTSEIIFPVNKRQRFGITIVSVVLLLIAGLVRFEMLFLTAAFFALVIGLLCVHGKARCVPRLVLLLAGIAVAAGLFRYMDLQYYKQSPGWEQYHEYNAARVNFIDRERIDYTPETAPIMKAVGWSENDFKMLTSWFYIDKERYALDKLHYVIDHAMPGMASRIMKKIGDFEFLPIFFDLYFIHFCLFALFICWPLHDSKSRLTVCVAIGWMVALCWLLVVFERYPPPRIWRPMLALCSAILILFSWFQPSRPSYSFKGRLSGHLVLGCALVFYGLAPAISADDTTEKGMRIRREDMRALHPKPDQLYVIWRNAIHAEFILHPFENPLWLKDFKFIQLGVAAHEPATHSRFLQNNITDLAHALFTRDSIYLIAREEELSLLKVYIREHYGVKIKYIPYYEGRQFTVYHVQAIGREQ